jgi:hypothetical protein
MDTNYWCAHIQNSGNRERPSQASKTPHAHTLTTRNLQTRTMCAIIMTCALAGKQLSSTRTSDTHTHTLVFPTACSTVHEQNTHEFVYRNARVSLPTTTTYILVWSNLLLHKTLCIHTCMKCTLLPCATPPQIDLGVDAANPACALASMYHDKRVYLT